MLTQQDRAKGQGALRAARASIAGRDDLATPSVEPDAEGSFLKVIVETVIPDDPGCVADVRVMDDGGATGQLILSVPCPMGLLSEGNVTLLMRPAGGQPLLLPAGGGGGGAVTNNYQFWFASIYGSE